MPLGGQTRHPGCGTVQSLSRLLAESARPLPAPACTSGGEAAPWGSPLSSTVLPLAPTASEARRSPRSLEDFPATALLSLAAVHALCLPLVISLWTGFFFRAAAGKAVLYHNCYEAATETN